MAAQECQIRLSRNGDVSIVTFTGTPHKANVFDADVLRRLSQVLDEIEEHAASNPSAVIFTGTGKFFSAGFDLKALRGEINSTASLNRSPSAEGPRLVRESWKVLARILVFPAPTIALFNGHAYGLGLFLGLACDFRVIIDSEDRFLCLPEITIGLPLGSGFAALAVGKLAPAALRTSTLTGKQWKGREALEAGIVDLVVPSSKEGSVPESVLEFARTLVPTSSQGNLSSIKFEIYGDIHRQLLYPEENLQTSKL